MPFLGKIILSLGTLPREGVQGDHKPSSQWKQKPLVAATSEMPIAQVSRTPAVDGPDPLIPGSLSIPRGRSLNALQLLPLPGAREVGKGIIKEEGDKPFFITKNISTSWRHLCTLSPDHKATHFIT